MARPVVGLDIGSSCVKAIQLRRAGRSAVELEKFGIAEVNAGGPPLTGASAREAKTEAIRSALRQAGISAKQVISSVSGEPIIVRYIQLPDMPENELMEALKWEAEEYIPFDIQDVNLGSAILGKSADGSKVNVLLVAAKKDLVNEHIETIQAANLKPLIVDVDSFAFLNCYEMNYQPNPSSITALINIGSTITNINVYHNGVSQFSRDVAIAGNSITAAIQNKLGKEWREAEQLKIMEGAPMAADVGDVSDELDGEQSSLLDTIRGTVEKITGEEADDNTPEAIASKVTRGTLNSLLGEVRRSIQFCENQADGKPIERVMLGGGGARMKNISEYFSAELRLPTEIMDPFKRISPRSSVDGNTLEASKLFLGVGIGLALRKVID
jgi:type IV pilus assembly protein PilM